MTLRMKTLTLATSLLAVALLTGAVAQATTAWKRTYFGTSSLSALIPGTVSEPEITKVTDDDDWVTEVADYTVDAENFGMFVSISKAKTTQKLDGAFVKKELVPTLQSTLSPNDETAIPVQEIKVDEKWALQAKFTRKNPAGEQTYYHVFATVEGTNLIMIVGVAFPELEGSVTDLDKAMKSVRLKKGLK